MCVCTSGRESSSLSPHAYDILFKGIAFILDSSYLDKIAQKMKNVF